MLWWMSFLDRARAGWIERPPSLSGRPRDLRRALTHGAALAGLLIGGTIGIRALATAWGFDSIAYWAVDPAHPYAAGLGRYGAFLYSPVFAQVFGILGWLSWPAFLAVWTTVLVAAYLWLARSSALWLLAFPPVVLEIAYGNINLLLAAAIVLGFRYPWTWAFVLLSKVTPGVGLTWFVARREWRSLAIALGATVLIATLSFVIAPSAWIEWVRFLAAQTGGVQPTNSLAIPLSIRLPIAIAIAWWGGRTDRAWTVPLSALIAAPAIWHATLSLLVGAVALAQRPELAKPRPQGPTGMRLDWARRVMSSRAVPPIVASGSTATPAVTNAPDVTSATRSERVAVGQARIASGSNTTR